MAWLAAVPCALLTVVAIALLGPPLGHAFLGPRSERFWPTSGAYPEPVEHGRYLLALLGPPLLAAIVIAGARWRPSVSRVPIGYLTGAAQLVALGFVVICFAAQHNVIFSADRPFWDHTQYFRPKTLVLAIAMAAALPVAMRTRTAAAWVARTLRETLRRRIAALVLASLFTAVWLLTVVDLDSSIGNTTAGVSGHILWSMDETFAILDGRTPLVNFHSQYGQLWPYLVAAAMAVLGTTIGAYTIVMASISGLVLLAIYGVFRRIVHSSLAALALYLPFVATGFYMKLGPLGDRFGPANLFSLWPVRYGGPYLLAWLLTRHVDRVAPRRTWLLFLAAGLVVLNNPEFGIGAFAGTLVALACVTPPRSWTAAGRLLGSAAAGMGGAVVLVSLLTLVRSGELPHFGLLTEFIRLYGVGGWAMLPMPRIGLYLVVYLTFGAALVVAVVRAARRSDAPALTAMLAWSAIFGLVAGGYFAGRSHPQSLIDLFSPWMLSVVLLFVAAVQALAAREWRRPTVSELLVLFGFGLAVCSLAQTPAPWSQLDRIRDRTPTPVFRQNDAKRFIASVTRRGERVEILIPLGHRIAYDLGLVNVSPYSSIESIPTVQQLRSTLDELRASGARKLFISSRFTFQEKIDLILSEGFKVHRQVGDTAELVRTR